MEWFFVVKILILPLAVFTPAFFSCAESALTSLSSVNIQTLKARERPGISKLLAFWENHPDKILATIILGNTVGTVFSGTLAASIGKDCAAIFHWPGRWIIPLLSFSVTILVLIFGEILPKILGRLHSERLAKWAIVPLVPLTEIIHPLVQILVRIAGIAVRILGAEPQRDIPTINAVELKAMLQAAESSGTADTSHRILSNILEFGRLKVKDIQMPRNHVLAIDFNLTTKQIIGIAAQSPFSRIPVYRGSLDNIIGIIYAKDLLTAWRTEGLIIISDLLRPVYFVPEQTSVSELLREFKKGRHHFAVAIDAEKKMTGIVTIEDLLEEIVGELYDESKIK